MSIRYNFMDIKLDGNNDISFTNGEFNTCVLSDAFEQHIKTRILTNQGEIPLHSKIGANLEELEGMPNTRGTGDYGVTKIRDSINADQTIDVSEINVRAVPTGKSEITFYTYAELDDGFQKDRVFVDTAFSLNNGIFIKK